MIFLLRILVFSFLILLGFQFSVRSRNLRKVISLIYGCVLVYYTFLCRIRLSVDVSASDYGHAVVTMSTGEKIWKLLQAIFGMDSTGHLAGVYWQAFILNILLFVPMGYLVYLHFLCESLDAITPMEKDAEESITRKNLIHKAVWSLLICVITSVLIELLQGLTGLGMTDVLDVVANSIGGVGGVGLTLVWLRKHFSVSE